MKHLPNPKDLSDQDLWRIILNVWPAGEKNKAWYKSVEAEFSKRKVQLQPVMNVTYKT